MAKHAESDAKYSIRQLLLRGSEALGRTDLRFLGLPAEKALDIKVLRPLLSSAICIAKDQDTIDECSRSLATIPLKHVQYYKGDAWQFLRDEYHEEELADVTYLDFYGGGFREQPFLKELPALENYFLRHAMVQNRAFIFAWTYMPRDGGEDVYEHAIKYDRIDKKHEETIRKLRGLAKRSYIIRLVLARLLSRHGFSATIYHHAVYKNTMNALIIVFSKGLDPQCKLALSPASDELLVSAPFFSYSDAAGVQRKFLVDS